MPVSAIPAFQYTPGDRHRYTWDGDAWIIVERISQVDQTITFTPTGDAIPAPATRTGTAFMAAVNEWRRTVRTAMPT